MQVSIEDYIRDNLRYDPNTGSLWWVKQTAGSGYRKDLNKPAGCLSGGYIIVGIGPKAHYRAHRIAWFLYYGCWPKVGLDHINGIKNDNRIVNLREATHKQNSHNAKGQSNRSSKHKGVNWDKENKKWRGSIQIDGKPISLGRYETEEGAALAYNKVALEYFGEFAKINDVTP